MTEHGGQWLVPSSESSEQCYPASVLLPGFSPEAFAPNLHQWGLPSIALEDSLSPELEPVTLREKELMQELKESHERESALSNSLDSVTSRLCYEMHQGKGKETQILEWKSLYSDALASYQENEEELRIKQMEQEETDLPVNAQVSDLQFQLGVKQTELEELAVVISQIDLAIIALEDDKKVFLEELRRVINGSIEILWEVSEQVLDLTADLQAFQSTAPRRARQELPTTGTLLECSMAVTNKIRDAESAWTEAVKVWKRTESVVEVMESYNRNRLLARILGKEEPGVSDAGTTMEISQ